jgi:hypothetical protein
MAKPSKEDFDRVFDYLQNLESILTEEKLADTDEKEGAPIKNDGEAIVWLSRNWKQVSHRWERLLWAGKTAIDNLCDPDASVLEVKPEIQSRVNVGDFVLQRVAKLCADGVPIMDRGRELTEWWNELIELAQKHLQQFGEPKE